MCVHFSSPLFSKYLNATAFCHLEPNHIHPCSTSHFWHFWQQLLLSFSTTGMHCLPATSHAANEYRFRCFTSCTISKKNSYVMRKCLRNFQYSLASRCFSSGFISITYHLEKSDRGWTCRVCLASNRGWNRNPRPLLSPTSPCSLARLKSEPTRLRS